MHSLRNGYRPMHNGVGLQSSRDSSTNGIVRKNLAHHVRSKDRDSLKKLNETSGSSLRKLNSDIAEHDRKRKLEIKCLELQQMLEDQKCPEDEIEKRVSSFRLSLIQESTSNATKDKHKRTRTKEILENAASQSRKSNQLREAFDISERFVGVSNASNIEPKRRANEAAVEQTTYAQIAPSPSSEEEEGEIAEERSSRKTKKRSRKSFSPKIDSKKKKKKKKKHKRKSKSNSQRKKKSRHKDKHDRRIKTLEQSSEYHEDEVDERYGESRSRRRSETPEQYRQRPASHRAKEKFSKTSDFRQYRRNIVDNRIEVRRCSDSQRKRSSETPEHASFEKRGAHHSEAKAHKKQKRTSSRQSPSTEDIDDYRSTSSMSKRRPRCSETPPPVDRKRSFYNDVDVKSFERRRQRRSPTPKKYLSGRGAHHSEDRASKKDKMRPFPEPSTSAIDARYSRPTSSSSKQFFHETNSKTSRIRHSSSPETAENGQGHDQSRTTQARSSEVATKRTKQDEKNDRRNEKSLMLRYFDSESDEAEESECETMTMRKDDENDLIKRRMSPLPIFLQRQTHQDMKSCGSPKPSSSPSPLRNSRQPEAAGVASEVPKKTDEISNKETFHSQVVVEEMPNNGRANVEREMASKSKLAVERIEDKTNKIKFDAIGKSHKKVELRGDEEEVVSRSSKVDPIVQPTLQHQSPDKGNGKVEEMGVESNNKVMPSAADMVDEAVKKTMTALALNRDKTLASLRKLLSCSLPKSKEGCSDSSLKMSRKERRSVSSNSDSGSSDSSQSSRSRNLSTSFSENSSESSNCSRASSHVGRKRKHRSRLWTKMSRGSQRRSSSKSSDTSGSRSSGSHNSSSSREEKTKKRRKTDRSLSSSSSRSSRSRSTSIPRRKGSPSFLERRRITSARRRPVPYPRSAILYSPSPQRSTSYQSSSSSSSSVSNCSSTASKHSKHDSKWHSTYSLV